MKFNYAAHARRAGPELPVLIPSMPSGFSLHPPPSQSRSGAAEPWMCKHKLNICHGKQIDETQQQVQDEHARSVTLSTDADPEESH